MMAIFIILIIVVLAFLWVRHKRKSDVVIAQPDIVDSVSPQNDNNKTLTKTRLIPRKTYLSGLLKGKYWGEMVIHHQADYEHEAFYEFHIYEAEVEIYAPERCHCISLSKSTCSGLHTETEGKFHFKDGTLFSKDRLPQLLPIIVKQDGKEYKVNIHEIELANVTFIAPLHQTHGQEVFGTIEASVIGCLLDFIEEEYPDDDFIEDFTVPKPKPATIISPHQWNPNRQRAYDYTFNRRHGYYNRHNNSFDMGCISSVIGIIVIFTWATLLITLLPQAVFFLPFIVVPLLSRLIPLFIWRWLGNIISLVIALVFIAVIIGHIRSPYVVRQKIVIPRHTAESQRTETSVNDTTITHRLSWQDYNGNLYAGKITIQRSALNAASQFKTSLQLSGNNLNSYDEMVYRIKEHDKDHLSGVYALFDSIRSAQNLKSERFAELVVSFVQQIPYAVVLPKDCNASLYSDEFIKDYLSTPDAKCDGNEKFGINTPVEFMANLKGDCDTRTLLLYTMLSHYDYDVVLLSSEYYNHSLIGLNLPYDGIAFINDSKRYVPWETTAADIRPGILPNEISNLNYWRISLKSK